MDKNKIFRREIYVSGLHLREAENGQESRTIKGYAILFNSPSVVMMEDEGEVVREKISPSAVTRELLDSSDFVMTMFHNNQLVLARSKKGEGTLNYNIDERGVSFDFEAPNTADGDKAIELVRRGDIDGCSFAFSTHYWDEDYVSCSSEVVDNKIVTTYSIDRITGIYDFTLTPNPAYPDTECSCRELVEGMKERQQGNPSDLEKRAKEDAIKRQIAEMREAAKIRI